MMMMMDGSPPSGLCTVGSDGAVTEGLLAVAGPFLGLPKVGACVKTAPHTLHGYST
jgi:hypothetical protein